jgi:hypothetical protein
MYKVLCMRGRAAREPSAITPHEFNEGPCRRGGWSAVCCRLNSFYARATLRSCAPTHGAFWGVAGTGVAPGARGWPLSSRHSNSWGAWATPRARHAGACGGGRLGSHLLAGGRPTTRPPVPARAAALLAAPQVVPCKRHYARERVCVCWGCSTAVGGGVRAQQALVVRTMACTLTSDVWLQLRLVCCVLQRASHSARPHHHARLHTHTHTHTQTDHWASCPCAHKGERAARRDWRVYSYAAIACDYAKQVGACVACLRWRAWRLHGACVCWQRCPACRGDTLLHQRVLTLSCAATRHRAAVLPCTHAAHGVPRWRRLPLLAQPFRVL